MRTLLLVVISLTFACKARKEPQPRTGPGSGSGSGSAVTNAGNGHDAITRADFNRFAVRENLPVYWIADANNNKTIEPDETAALLFYGSEGKWIEGGKFTKDFEDAYAKIVAAAKAA